MDIQNQWLVYPGAGIFRVCGTGLVSGVSVIRLENTRGTRIMVPTDKVRIVTRPVGTTIDIDTAFKIMERPIQRALPSRKKIELMLSSSYNGGSLFEMAELVGLLLRVKSHRRLSVREKRYLDECIDQIAEETSIATGTDKADAARSILACVKKH